MNSRRATSSAYLHLQSVAPVHNRYRLYTIRIDASDSPEDAPLTVICAWGRIGQQRQRRVYVYGCEDREAVEKLLCRLLRIRLRHGYGVVEQGKDFPELDILAEFPVVDGVGEGQLGLFGV